MMSRSKEELEERIDELEDRIAADTKELEELEEELEALE